MRRATPEDVAAIDALVEAAYAHYVARIGLRPAPMDADHAAEVARGEVWVLPGEGADVDGVVVLRVERDHIFVDNIAVAPERQREGVGRMLLELAERRAAEHGLAELRLLTNERMTENRAIYEHLGWEETERRVERGYARVYFRKRLTHAEIGT